MSSRVPLTFDPCKTAISEETDLVVTMHEGPDLLLESIHTYASTIDHVAWRVTPTTDLGKPLDLLLHPPSGKEEGRLGGRRGLPGKKKLGRGEEEANRRQAKSVTAFYSRMIAGIQNRKY